MPLIAPNYIALAQTMYEKSVSLHFVYTLLYFCAPGEPPVPKFTYLGTDGQQGPDYQCATLRFLSFCQPVYEICQCPSMSMSIKSFFSVARIAELSRRPRGRSRVRELY